MNMPRRLAGHTFGVPSRPQRLWIVLTIGFSLVVMVGSLGPWLTWERPSAAAPEGLARSGIATSGVFTLVFATLAIALLVAALHGWDLGGFAWGTFGLLVLAAITGLFEWLLIADRPASANDPTQAGWGMIAAGLAGLAGAIVAFLAARALNDH